MKTRFVGALVLAVAVLLAFAPDRANAAETITAHCSPAPENCTGWYRANVTVQWTWDAGGLPENCAFLTISTDTAGTPVRCSVSFNGDPPRTLEITIRRDATRPQVTGIAPARAPDSGGWYNRPVAIAVTGTDATSGIASCSSPQYAGPDGASREVTGTCTDAAGNTSPPTVATLKYDETPPAVTAAPTRDPDAGGWYNHTVAIAAAGSDLVSGVATCTASSYSGPDSAAASTSARCVDNAGNTSAAATATLKYDATAPTIAARVDRPPDAGDWYRAPLKISFTGSDATSGVASCTPQAEYKGPDGTAIAVAGTCRDAAGNSADTTVDFDYDATAPKLEGLDARSEKGLVRLGWRQAGDAVSTRLVRTPGLRGAPSSVVYSGAGHAFADRSVQNGRSYRYVLTLGDSAGNVTSKGVTAAPRPPLYRPALNSVVHAPLRLAWEATGASFYNVQLRRDGVKVLSAWPRGPTLTVRSTWRYEGKKYVLGPGSYRWWVWAARGSRERPNYGRPLGTSTFVVKR